VWCQFVSCRLLGVVLEVAYLNFVGLGVVV
jgi:hypothetical protein